MRTICALLSRQVVAIFREAQFGKTLEYIWDRICQLNKDNHPMDMEESDSVNNRLHFHLVNIHFGSF